MQKTALSKHVICYAGKISPAGYFGKPYSNIKINHNWTDSSEIHTKPSQSKPDVFSKREKKENFIWKFVITEDIHTDSTRNEVGSNSIIFFFYWYLSFK